MLTGKQRSNLRAQANSLEPIMHIGKTGVTEGVLKQLNEYLFHNELVKISVLEHCEYSAAELVEALADGLKAEPVQCIGRKIVLYKKTEKEGFKHLSF